MRLHKLGLIGMLVGTLAVIGCSSDGGGSGGTAGSGGMAGSGGSAPMSTCDAFCAGTCVLDIFDETLDPSDPNCESQCGTLEPNFATDDCGDEMQAYLDCAGPGPDCIDPTCANLFNAWDACAQGS